MDFQAIGRDTQGLQDDREWELTDEELDRPAELLDHRGSCSTCSSCSSCFSCINFTSRPTCSRCHCR